MFLFSLLKVEFFSVRALNAKRKNGKLSLSVWLYQKLKCNAMHYTQLLRVCNVLSFCRSVVQLHLNHIQKVKCVYKVGRRAFACAFASDWLQSRAKKIVTTNKCNWLNFIKCCCTKTSINYLGQQQKADTVLSIRAATCTKIVSVYKVSQMCYVCCTWNAYVILSFHRIFYYKANAFWTT